MTTFRMKSNEKRQTEYGNVFPVQSLRCHLKDPKITERSGTLLSTKLFPSAHIKYLRRAGVECFVQPQNIDCSRLRRSYAINVTSVHNVSENSVKMHRCDGWSVIAVKRCKVHVVQTQQPRSNTARKRQARCSFEKRQTRTAISSAPQKPWNSSGHDEGNSMPVLSGKRRMNTRKI